MFLPVCIVSVLLFASCAEAPKKDSAVESTTTETPKQDMAQVRSEIAAIEKQWAAAENAKDVNALMALYADDAVTMPDGAASISGKAAIQKYHEANYAKPAKHASIDFETVDVYGQGDVVTEVGKTMYKDAAGKTIGSGKYVAIYEKRDGKYVCIREIYNKDSK